MRNIAIIGSGIAGLLTAHGLLQAGYNVSLYSDRTADQWLNESRPTGAAARLEPALSYERELGLNFWEADAPRFKGVHLTFCAELNNPLLKLVGHVPTYGQAVDVRLQSHRWLNEFEQRGGQLFIERVTLQRLDKIAQANDLTLVASGRGQLSHLFPRDDERSVYDKPQRNLAMVIVKNTPMQRRGVPFLPVTFNFTAPAGEAFWVPFFHKTHGATWALIFEARPGTPLDRFQQITNGYQAVATAKQVIRELFPWDWAWAKHMELADENGWLTGRFAPTVREPVGYLPSGRVVTPIGDASIAFDPIGGQGANTATKMARHMVKAITAHGDKTFDSAWMRDTFERFYIRHAGSAYTFNNMLLEPLTPAGQELLIAQVGSDGYPHNTSGAQKIANAFCANFVDPTYLTPTFQDRRKARAFIQQQTGQHWLIPAIRGRATVGMNQLRQKLARKDQDATVATLRPATAN